MPPRPRRSLPRRAASLVVLGAVASVLAAGSAGPAGAAATAGPAGALRAEPSGTVASVVDDGGVILPVDGAVTRLFVRPAQRWSPGHRGVDLAAEPGTAVRSPIAGTVEFAGPVAGRTVLTVARADGLRCSLEPLADVAEPGTPVRAGDVVGVVAAGHCAGSGCLHWGARRGGDYVDPLGLLAPVTTVLLPWP